MLIAETTGWDVLLEVVKLVAMIATGIFAVIAANRAGRAEKNAEATAAEVVEVKGKVDQAAEHAAVGRRMAKAAAQVSIASDKKADTIGQMLSRVEKQTNGQNERLREERDAAMQDLAETRRKLEAALAALPPIPVADAIFHVVETTDAIADKVGAPKSGTKLNAVKVDPAHPPKRRHDDPH